VTADSELDSPETAAAGPSVTEEARPDDATVTTGRSEE
jgi:hypothetical protein